MRLATAEQVLNSHSFLERGKTFVVVVVVVVVDDDVCGGCVIPCPPSALSMLGLF